MIADRLVASYFDTLSERLNEYHLDLALVLSEFYSILGSHLATAQTEHRRLNFERASDFSTFVFFRPDENTLSRIMTDLLKPTRSHGQGKIFLDRFLDHVGHPGLAAQSVFSTLKQGNRRSAPGGPDADEVIGRQTYRPTFSRVRPGSKWIPPDVNWIGDNAQFSAVFGWELTDAVRT